MIEGLAALLREGLSLALINLLPLFAVAAATALLVGLLASALGIRDGILGQIARALAVVLTLALIAEQGAAQLIDFAGHAWSGRALE